VKTQIKKNGNEKSKKEEKVWFELGRKTPEIGAITEITDDYYFFFHFFLHFNSLGHFLLTISSHPSQMQKKKKKKKKKKNYFAYGRGLYEIN
jgi:hypothetical protein